MKKHKNDRSEYVKTIFNIPVNKSEFNDKVIKAGDITKICLNIKFVSIYKLMVIGLYIDLFVKAYSIILKLLYLYNYISIFDRIPY